MQKQYYTIRTVWGLARSPEINMTSDDLHALVESLTGKGSLKDLNRKDIGMVIGALQNLKDIARGTEYDRKQRGNRTTENQRKKVYVLTRQLGWEKEARINGLCRKMFGVSAVEWLDYSQCSKLIEALKAMVKREKEEA